MEIRETVQDRALKFARMHRILYASDALEQVVRHEGFDCVLAPHYEGLRVAGVRLIARTMVEDKHYATQYCLQYDLAEEQIKTTYGPTYWYRDKCVLGKFIQMLPDAFLSKVQKLDARIQACVRSEFAQ